MSYLWYWPAGGWSFDKWRKVQTWEPVRSEQSGNPRPLRLVQQSLDSEVERLKQWEEDAPRWRATSKELLGAISDEPPKQEAWESLGDELTGDATGPAYTLRRLRFRLTASEWGYAWLLRPKRATKAGAAVLALHQTSPSGKGEVVGLERVGQTDYMHYAVELVKLGYIVLAPDAIAFGERQAGHANTWYHSAEEFFGSHPSGSVMGKMMFDVARAVDVLQQLPGVDGRRIGCVGHSHGGYGTLFGMLGDPRIRVGVVSCGMNLVRFDPTPDRWWAKTALIPRLGLYSEVREIPMDFHHWLGLIAPRPMMVVAGTRDEVFPNVDDMPAWLGLAREVYALYGAGDKLQSLVFDGTHKFPPEGRRAAYRLLENELR